MSATRGKSAAERDPLDRYYTPAAWVDAVLGRWDAYLTGPHSPKTILEPSIGAGAWSAGLRRVGYRGKIVGVDLDPDVRPEGVDTMVFGDFAAVGEAVIAEHQPALIIGNLPYRDQDRILEHLFAARCSISLLTRTCWLQSVRVRRLIDLRRPTQILLATGRLAFDGPGITRKTTDAADYCQVSWRPSPMPSTSVDWLDWKRKP